MPVPRLLVMDRLAGGMVPQVSLGGYACTSVSTLDAADGTTNVSCVAASGAPGAAAVAVLLPTRGDAQVAAGVSFTYVVAITAVSPASGSAGGGTLLTVNGAGFEYLGHSNASSAGVTVGGQPCAVASLTATQITCTTPAVVAASDGLEAWVNSFYPSPPSPPSPSPPPSPPPSSPSSPPPSPSPSLPPSPPPAAAALAAAPAAALAAARRRRPRRRPRPRRRARRPRRHRPRRRPRRHPTVAARASGGGRRGMPAAGAGLLLPGRPVRDDLDQPVLSGIERPSTLPLTGRPRQARGLLDLPDRRLQL